jgi:hypothetical protein
VLGTILPVDGTSVPNGLVRPLVRRQLSVRRSVRTVPGRQARDPVLQRAFSWLAPPARRGGATLLAASISDRVAAAALVGAGILTGDDSGDLRLHPDAAASLLVPSGTADV